MIQLGLLGTHADLDVAKIFPIGQLCKSHAEELIQTREVPHSIIASIPIHAFVELVLG